MKTIKTVAFALFCVMGGLLFAACSTPKDFDENKIVIGNNTFVYDKQAHGIEIEYESVDVDVSFALENDKENFKSIEELNIVNAGSYDLFYKLSAKGYKSYVSNGTLELIIQPKNAEILINTTYIKGANKFINFYPSTSGVVKGDSLNLSYSYEGVSNAKDLPYGEYKITCTSTNHNYNLTTNENSTLKVIDYFELKRNDETIGYYDDLQQAIDSAKTNDDILIHANYTLNKGITVTNSVSISSADSSSKPFEIMAKTTFESMSYADKTLTSMFNVFDSNVELTLKNITLNGNSIARSVSMFHGTLNIDGATITKGKKTDNFRSGGVYLTNDSSLNMTSGQIVKNDANDSSYVGFCADLWVGANANGSLVTVTGGKIDNVFVNSNSYSATDAGKFTLNGGNIHSVYIEYDAGFGAKFEYISGNVNFLMVAKQNPSETETRFEYVDVKENTTYIGGTSYNN